MASLSLITVLSIACVGLGALSSESHPRLESISVSARLWIPGGPCAKNDFDCQNRVSVKYINDIRKRHGKKPLAMGTKFMLDNALKHSREMAAANSLGHQPLRKGVTVGQGSTCKAQLTSENIAESPASCTIKIPGRPRYCRLDNVSPTDVMKQCADQWEGSPPHLKSILDDHVNTVVGIFVTADDHTWCTQTFSKVPAGSSGNCAPASQSGNDTQEPVSQSTTQPTAQPTTQPTAQQGTQPTQPPAPTSTPKPTPMIFKVRDNTGRVRQISCVWLN